ncbi:MAG: hypothetical protein CL535_03620 [Ahrensia sp.]|nr:hypothetical protein [Ahrensia sp.]
MCEQHQARGSKKARRFTINRLTFPLVISLRSRGWYSRRMKPLLAVLALTILLVWDFAQNNGEMTSAVIRSFMSFARSFGF